MDWLPPPELPDLRRVSLISLDLETRDDRLLADMGSGWPFKAGYICGVSVAYRTDGEIRGLYFPLRHPDTENFSPEHVYQWLRDHIAAGVRFTTQNGLYDWGWLRAEAGIHMPPSERIEEIGALATMVDENRFKYSLDALCSWRGLPGKDEMLLLEGIKALGLIDNKRKKIVPQNYIWQLPARYVGPYAEADAVGTLGLLENLNPILDQEGTRAAYRLECDILPLVLEMRRRGIRIDLDAAERARDLLLHKRDAALAELSARLGCVIGLHEIQGKKWLAETFDRLGIKYPHTEKGNPSFTAGKTGWMTGHAHWLPRLIATANKYNKAATDFLQKIIDYTVNSRIHAEINPHRSEDNGTKSFRFSYNDPPLQQMPSRDEELAPLIRGVFLPEEGEVWGKPDASQQEFRLVVHYANQHKLPKAAEAVARYRDDPDTDFHAFAATITGLERKAAKNVNFAKVYGAGVSKFAAMIGKPLQEAQRIYEQYDRELPFLRKLSDIYSSRARSQGFISLYDGARRHFDRFAPGGKWEKGAGPCGLEEAQARRKDPEHPWYRRGPLYRADVHTALNALIQGSAARHTKLWMRACWREGIVPLLQLHDCLDCSVSSYAQAELVARLGCEAIQLDVPMRVDLKFGRTWGDAKHSWEELHGLPARPAPTITIEATAVPVGKTPTCEHDKPQQPKPASIAPEETAPEEIAPEETAPEEIGPEDARLLHITFFRDQYAKSLKTKDMTLAQLRELIEQTDASEKARLPWLKLAEFGDRRTEKNSLRHDANVIEIDGIELDYDQKVMPLDDAIEILNKAELQSLVYTSPSYKPEAPKWRILLPTSKALEPEKRLQLAKQVSRLFGDIFSAESFTLSQAYYYGSVNKNPNHRVEIIDGDCIDLCAGIDDVGEKATNKINPFGEYGEEQEKQFTRDDIAQYFEDIRTGAEFHVAMRTIAMHLVKAGMHPGAVVKLLRGLMNTSEAPRDGRWKQRFDDIRRTVEGAERKCGQQQEEEPKQRLNALKSKLLQSSAEFVEGYMPPDYLIDGLLQRRYVYSLTAPTGSGKTCIAMRIAIHVALGLPLGGREVEKGRVLFFAGENPDDVRSRWIMLCEEMGYEPKDIDVFFMPFTLDLEKFRKQIDAETAEHGPFSLLIVDTSASYYTGNEENDNVQLGDHARMLRTFVNLPGGPTILVTCHPTKTPNMENLLPRGGGAFLAEVDGNLVCLKEAGSMVVEITTHGKFRGPEFKPFAFKLVPGKSDKLVDTKGRHVWTVTAQPISDVEQAEIEKAGDCHQDELLRTMLDYPGLSLVEMAEKLNWITVNGQPNKTHVFRMLKDLAKEKLVEKQRKKHYVLTAKGEKEAEQLPKVEYIGIVPRSDEERTAKAAKGSKSKVRSDPPKEKKSTAKVSFMITKKQKRRLIEELGYSEEEVFEMKPERVHEILKNASAQAPLEKG